MKKLILMTILSGLIAAPVLAGPTFSFSWSEAQAFVLLGTSTASSVGSLTIVTAGNGDYGAALAGDVGYKLADVGTTGYIAIGNEAIDLTGFDSVATRIYNDNNQDWKYKLFAFDGTTTLTSASWRTIDNGGNSDWLTLDISSGFSPDGTDTAGFLIASTIDQSDTMHTSIAVPAPGAVLLGGIGVALVGWLRRRRTL